MDDKSFDKDLIDSVLTEDHTNSMVDWCKRGLNFLESKFVVFNCECFCRKFCSFLYTEQENKETEIKNWVKRAKQHMKYLEDIVLEKDREILKLSSDNMELRTDMNKLSKDHEILKTEHQKMKQIVRNEDATRKGVKLRQKFNQIETFNETIKLTESPRRKITPTKSPDENECPEKHKKLKGLSWMSVDKERKSGTLDRKTSMSLSLTKPGPKLKQSHLNFTKEHANADETFCSELENDKNVPSTPTRLRQPIIQSNSPSRFRCRKVKRILDGLKESKVPEDSKENPFESIILPPKRTEINTEPESKGMNTAIMHPEHTDQIDEKESQESDVIMLPTQAPEIIEILDSNDSIRLPVVKLSKNLSAVASSSKMETSLIMPEKKVQQDPVDDYVPGFCKQCIDVRFLFMTNF